MRTGNSRAAVAAAALWALVVVPLSAEDLSTLKRRVSSEIEKQKTNLYKHLKAAPGHVLVYDVLIYKNAQGDYWSYGPVRIWTGKAPLETGIASAKPPLAEDKVRRTAPSAAYKYSSESYMFAVQLEGSTVQMVPVSRPVRGTIHLTFDDGPNEGTSEVLSVLKATDIKGTFFVVGGRPITGGKPEQKRLFAQIIADGHRIGNHTYTHYPSLVSEYEKAYSNPLTPPQKIMFVKNYTDNLEFFREFSGGPINFKLARLPGAGKMRRNLVAETKDLGLKHCGWDWEFAPNGKFDWVKYRDWQNISGVAADHAQGDLPAQGSIILFHDAHWKGKSPLLTKVIEHLMSNGYKFDVLAD